MMYSAEQEARLNRYMEKTRLSDLVTTVVMVAAFSVLLGWGLGTRHFAKHYDPPVSEFTNPLPVSHVNPILTILAGSLPVIFSGRIYNAVRNRRKKLFNRGAE